MKHLIGILAVAGVILAPSAAAPGPFKADPPDRHHPWAVHDQNRPLPKVVTPGEFSTQEQPGTPPSDAVVLFDGTEAALSNWASDRNPNGPTTWIVKDGALECVPKSGFIRSKRELGDCQLHVEWAAPGRVEGDGQGRGNSGIYVLGVEIQVLDSYNNPTYADGMACAIYEVNPPMANAVRPPGKYQMIDIVFRRPIYKNDQCLDPGYVTVFCNGVLVQDHTVLEGKTASNVRTKPGPLPEKGPIRLQDHGNPVRFRNIWYRELPPRAAEGGTDGPLSIEATMAKRREIAAVIRADAAKLRNPNDPLPEMLRLAESLAYDKDAPTFLEVEQMANRYVESLQQLSAEKLGAKQEEVMKVSNAFSYMAKFEIVPATFGPNVEVAKIVQSRNWSPPATNAKGKKK